MKRIGPLFLDELRAAGIEINSYVVGGTDADIWAPSADPAALKAVIDAHDPTKQATRTRVIADIIESLTPAEVATLQGIAAFRKSLWALLAKGAMILKEDDPKVAALATAIGTTPAELFNR